MSNWQWIRDNWRHIRIALYFLCTLVTLYLAIPRVQQFHYNIQRDKVWTHATIKAPYDYPIYKDPKVYADERAAIVESILPIFREDSTTVTRVIPTVTSYLQAQCLDWRDSLVGQAGNMYDTALAACRHNIENGRLQSIIESLYAVGIVNRTAIPNVSSRNNFSVLRNQIAYETSIENVYTPRLASAYIAKELARTTNDSLQRAFLIHIDLSPLLLPNLHYDSILTDKLRNERLSSLSKSLGIVRSGETIIEQGDIVTPERYIRLVSLRQEMANRQNRGDNVWGVELGYFLLLAVSLTLLYLFLRHAYPTILQHDRQLLFILLLNGLSTIIGFLVIRYAPMVLYIVPFAIVSLLSKTFFDSRLAFTLLLYTVCTLGFFAPDSYMFTLLNLVAGGVAVFASKRIYRRGGLFRAVGFILLAYLVTYVIITLVQEGNLKNLNPYNAGLLVANALLLLASYQLMYPIEQIFGFISNATLLELGDFNQNLLRELSEKAPGTFQHSMQVANLAEAATAKLGGNSLLARTGAIYHDIGKMLHPEYFTENQAEGINPHKQLSERESAEIIIRHVTDGVQIAHKHGLPAQIIDFIVTHHGTTRTEYFYRTYSQSHPDEPSHPEWFQYPGPKPFSKETAIVMMADSVEAASRSLKTITKDNIRNLVNSIIEFQQLEDQFNEADITFKEIQTIRNLFCQKLENIYHSRIEYPDAVDETAKHNKP